MGWWSGCRRGDGETRKWRTEDIELPTSNKKGRDGVVERQKQATGWDRVGAVVNKDNSAGAGASQPVP